MSINLGSSSSPTSKTYDTIKHGSYLGIISSGIGSVLFCVIYFICQEVYKNSSDTVTDLEWAIWVIFLLLGPIIGFAIMFIPGILSGGVIATLLRRLRITIILPLSLVLVAGIITGGLFGYAIAQIGESLSHFSRFTSGPYCGLVSGTIAGSVSGVWYSWKMYDWLGVN